MECQNTYKPCEDGLWLMLWGYSGNGGEAQSPFLYPRKQVCIVVWRYFCLAQMEDRTALAVSGCQNRSWRKTRCYCFWPLWYETFTDTSYLTHTWRALDLNAQAESKLLYSSVFLSLQNGLGLQDSIYWTYTQAMMHTWWLSNLILGSLKSSWPFAYCLKSHHGVRGFCLLRLQHKDSLRKRVVLERYPQP